MKIKVGLVIVRPSSRVTLDLIQFSKIPNFPLLYNRILLTLKNIKKKYVYNQFVSCRCLGDKVLGVYQCDNVI